MGLDETVQSDPVFRSENVSTQQRSVDPNGVPKPFNSGECLRRACSSTISRLPPHCPTNAGGPCPKKSMKPDMSGVSSRRTDSRSTFKTKRKTNRPLLDLRRVEQDNHEHPVAKSKQLNRSSFPFFHLV
jgi:hypothetical protein